MNAQYISLKEEPEAKSVLFSHIERHQTLPIEAIIKSDVLRWGLQFQPDALRVGNDNRKLQEYQPKSYFIFSFDFAEQSELDELHRWRAPEEVALYGGQFNLRRTIVSVRLNPKSPYTVAMHEGDSWLMIGDEPLARIQLPRIPGHYQDRLPDGRPVSEIAPVIEWGYLIYLTVFRICQYFGDKEECQFCDINHNYRQQLIVGRPYTGVKRIEDILEALTCIARYEPMPQAYTITGGSITSQLAGNSESEFYIEYLKAIEERFPARWIAKMVTQAWPLADVRRLKAAGAQIYHPNYEIWDPELFSKMCPGKARYIGRDEWIRRILLAAEVFEPSAVVPNFVGGIEMARPYGYTEVEPAIESTREGLEFFMSRGIAPRFTTWCPEPTTPLGKSNPGGAPLEFHLRLLEVYRDTTAKYNLAAPPGYGDPGVGRAVFSVSPFMDILPVRTSHAGVSL